MPTPKLSIIVPCLNEEDNLQFIFSALLDATKSLQGQVEIVLVDDQSEDQTYDLAVNLAEQHTETFPVRVVRRPLHRRGYGAAVRYGVAHAQGEYAIFVSADGVDPVT